MTNEGLRRMKMSVMTLPVCDAVRDVIEKVNKPDRLLALDVCLRGISSFMCRECGFVTDAEMTDIAAEMTNAALEVIVRRIKERAERN